MALPVDERSVKGRPLMSVRVRPGSAAFLESEKMNKSKLAKEYNEVLDSRELEREIDVALEGVSSRDAVRAAFEFLLMARKDKHEWNRRNAWRLKHASGLLQEVLLETKVQQSMPPHRPHKSSTEA